MSKKTTHLNLPIIAQEDYATTSVFDMIEGIQGDSVSSAFNIIDQAIEDNKVVANPSGESATADAQTIKINGIVYRLVGTSTATDASLSASSTNPIQNQAVYAALQDKVSSSEVQTMIDNAINNALNSGY